MPYTRCQWSRILANGNNHYIIIHRLKQHEGRLTVISPIVSFWTKIYYIFFVYRNHNLNATHSYFVYILSLPICFPVFRERVYGYATEFLAKSKLCRVCRICGRQYFLPIGKYFDCNWWIWFLIWHLHCGCAMWSVGWNICAYAAGWVCYTRLPYDVVCACSEYCENRFYFFIFCGNNKRMGWSDSSFLSMCLFRITAECICVCGILILIFYVIF